MARLSTEDIANYLERIVELEQTLMKLEGEIDSKINNYMNEIDDKINSITNKVDTSLSVMKKRYENVKKIFEK